MGREYKLQREEERNREKERKKKQIRERNLILVENAKLTFSAHECSSLFLIGRARECAFMGHSPLALSEPTRPRVSERVFEGGLSVEVNVARARKAARGWGVLQVRVRVSREFCSRLTGAEFVWVRERKI